MKSTILDPHLNTVPATVHRIHIMGICGTGMAALAGMLKAKGFSITGSDSHVYPPMSDFLASLRIEITEGYSADNLASEPDLVIVGNVITSRNPEAIGLARYQLPYLSFPQALAHFFIQHRTSLVVSGTHGKTTTSSLLASTLHHAGYDPSFMIGGIVKHFNANFRLGQGEHFISEGDEYDTAFFDKESKFLHYRPEIAIITSIEFDHADIFDNLDQIKESFQKFVSLIPPSGLLVAHLDDPNVAEVVQHARCEVQGYGMAEANYWRLDGVRAEGNTTRFRILREGRDWTETTINMIGEHNCLNGLAVTAVLHRLGLDIQDIQKGLAHFDGVKRRQEIRGIAGGVTVIDDFAHHPTAVRKTLAGLRRAYETNRLVVVFEPRTNSSRRAIFQQEYVASFADCDLVLLREPLPIPGLAQEELFSSSRLAADLNRHRPGFASSYADTKGILESLATILQPGDVVAILSNGGFDNIHQRLLDQLSVNGGKSPRM